MKLTYVIFTAPGLSIGSLFGRNTPGAGNKKQDTKQYD